MRVVIAPDSFKGTIGAAGAAAALAAGWRSARPGDQIIQVPLADGGEGTLDVLAAASTAARWHAARVSGPGTATVHARWLELPGGTHVIELAAAAGLPLLARPDPMGAHTAGAGQLIAAALDAGARRIVTGLGGSASTDGGTGALAALGARFLAGDGCDLPRGGGPLAGLAAADLSRLRPPPPGGAVCLTDVTAPLLGPAGAAAVFGPQKGAAPAQVAALEAGLTRLAAVLGGQPAEPGAGAAGGTGYGLAVWGATLASGSAEVARIAGLDAALAGAGLVITGEGRYDATSATGKVAGAVRAAAAAAGVPVAVAAGQVDASVRGRRPGDPPVSAGGGGSKGAGSTPADTAACGSSYSSSAGCSRRSAGAHGSGGTGRGRTGSGRAGEGSTGDGRTDDSLPAVACFVALAGLAGGTAAAMGEPARWLQAAGRQLATGAAGRGAGM